MKLYTYDPAPNPRRLTLFMAYKGISLPTEQIDMMSGAQMADHYRAINPDCTVPALVLDDGTVMTEVIGICTYLEAMYPDKPLLGSTPLEKALVSGWDHKLFNMVVSAVAEVLRNSSPGFVDRALPGPVNVPQIPALAERGKQRLEHAWQTLEAEITGKTFLAGEHLSLADIDLLVCAEFAGWVKSAPPVSCSALHTYLDRVRTELGLNVD
tara:strand:+ start:64693 stop:65325 length:633 start_codon:yes stop_codon:yes gene_type:complete